MKLRSSFSPRTADKIDSSKTGAVAVIGMVTTANEQLITANGRAIAYNELAATTFKRIADASVAAAARELMAREPMVDINGKEQHQHAMTMVMGKSANERTRTGDPKLQVSTAVK